MTEISISENFLEEYLTCATIEILPPLPCDNFYLPDSGRHVTSVHQGLSQAGAGEEPGYEVDQCNAHYSQESRQSMNKRCQLFGRLFYKKTFVFSHVASGIS